MIKFNPQCRHALHVCDKLANEYINNITSANINLTMKDLGKFIGNLYNSYYKCLNHFDWVPVVLIMLDKINNLQYNLRDTYHIIEMMITSNKNIVEIIVKMMNKYNIPISGEIFNCALEHKSLDLAMYLILNVNFKIKPEHIITLIKNMDMKSKLINIQIDLMNIMITNKIGFPPDALIMAFKHTCKYGDSSNPVINMMLSSGTKINNNCLNEALVYKNSFYVEKFMNELNYNIYPKFWDFLLKGSLYEKHNCSEHIANIIDIFIKRGYKITLQDVILCIKNKCYINNIESHNIKTNDEFWNTCLSISYYPYECFNKKMPYYILVEECKNVSNLDVIKKIISYGLIPKIDCLMAACQDSRANYEKIVFLVEQMGLIPDIQCIKVIAENIKLKSLTYILDNINKKPTDKPINISPISQNIITNTTTITHNILTTIQTQQNNNKIPDNIIKNMIKIKNPREILKNNTNTYEIKCNIKTTLNITNKKITFLEMRKRLLNYIINNNLCDVKLGNIIKINDKINDILNIGENKYISFDDIDNLVASCFK